MDFSLAFLGYFFRGLYLLGPLILFLLLIILILGQFVGRLEKWTRFDAVYWTLITAMTVGYGDFRPQQRLTKSLSLVIAFTGLILTGITVAIALEAATRSFKEYGERGAMQQYEQGVADEAGDTRL
jgi:voltage-gated potassium channel